LFIYLWTASQASRFFVEARRSGLLELLLTTPLPDRQIVRGQWRGFLRLFGWPVLLLLGVHIAGTTLSQLSFQGMAAKAGAATMTSTSTNSTGTATSTVMVFSTSRARAGAAATNSAPVAAPFLTGGGTQQALMALATASATALSTVANLVALCWFGMWMGMTSRSANLATLKTILFVQIIPWFVIAFGTSMMVGIVMAGYFARSGGAAGPGAWLMWWPFLNTLIVCAAALGKDLGFILWSRKKLYTVFREQASRTLGQPRAAAAAAQPPVAASIHAPPVMPANH
jgi:hypothetical protein